MDELEIREDSPRQPDVRPLIRDLDDYLSKLYPAESNHLIDIEDLCACDVRFLVARIGGRAVGCGALLLRSTYGEIKRMFVQPAMRSRKIGMTLLLGLEKLAMSSGLSVLRLETGIHQPEALKLYRATGYRERDPFGGYRPDPLSLFMEKVISG